MFKPESDAVFPPIRFSSDILLGQRNAEKDDELLVFFGAEALPEMGGRLIELTGPK